MRSVCKGECFKVYPLRVVISKEENVLANNKALVPVEIIQNFLWYYELYSCAFQKTE